jgi:hypothetical protein
LPICRLPREYAEAATVIRSTAEIRDLAVNADQKTITLQGDPGQVQLADWLFPRLDRRAGTPDGVQGDYGPIDGKDDLTRLFYFKNTAAVQPMNELTTVIRSLLEIRHAFVSSGAGALVLRGTRQQMDAARWLVDSLDQPVFHVESNQYHITDAGGEDTLRLFSLPKLGEQELQSFAVRLRMATRIRRLFVYHPLGIIAVRGTPAQLEQAATLVNQP